jgi:hypothetical protein
MRTITRITISLWVMIFLSGFGSDTVLADSTPRMTIDELRRTMDGNGTLIIDVRLASHWNDDTRKIKSAFRGDPKEFEKWAEIFPRAKVLVLYCD